MVFLLKDFDLYVYINCISDFAQNSRLSLGDDIYTNDELVSLLLKWCRVVCLFYKVKVSKKKRYIPKLYMLKNNGDLFIKIMSVCSIFLCVIVGRELHCIVQ